MSTQQPTAPYGYCRCGCGQRTEPQPQSIHARGVVRGEPKPYAPGHRNRRPAPSEGTHYRIEDRGYSSPCWIWLRALTRGYGTIGRGGKQYYAHRYLYEQQHGPIEEGLHLDHLCRVTQCCNPEHLEPVTPAENCHRSTVMKLTDEDVKAIRCSDEGPTALGRRYGVTPHTIYTIKTKRRRANV